MGEADSCRRTLSKSQRKSYVAAVNCMKSAPPLHDTTELPTVKSLFDDFLAVHIFQTANIHNTVRPSLRSHSSQREHQLTGTGHIFDLAPLLHLGLRAEAP